MSTSPIAELPSDVDALRGLVLEMQRKLDELTALERYDVIQLEGSQLASFTFDPSAVLVLDEHDMAGAFVRSFRLMHGRSERWFELVAGSAALIITVAMVYAFTTLMFPPLGSAAGASVFWLLIIAVTPIIQYAWSFFYLRLVEVEEPLLHEVGPMYAVAGAPTPPAARPAPPAETGPPGPVA